MGNTKEIKNAPSALLSYISMLEFLRTREKCREARAEGECFSHFSSVLKNSCVLICFYAAVMNRKMIIHFVDVIFNDCFVVVLIMHSFVPSSAAQNRRFSGGTVESYLCYLRR